MNSEQKKQGIIYNLNIQNGLFNPKKCPNRDLDFQFTFKEPEGTFKFYLSIHEMKSKLIEGIASHPECELVVDLNTLKEISGGYISPVQAFKDKRLSIKGNKMSFMRYFRKIYSGTTEWQLPGHLYKGTYNIESIKKVLILCCSPRCEKGATYFLAQHLAEGMKQAGAEVEILFPARMKINPCIGCFQCWVNDTSKCIYHEKDDMKIILEKYWSYDLVVWATPIYHYHGTTAMKTVMDRLFINADPHFIEVDGQYRHPRKVEHIPYYAVLGVGGFPSMNIFASLQCNFKSLTEHAGIKLIGELYRHTSMPFTVDDLKIKKRDEVLNALMKAGRELIELKKIKKYTKKMVEQKIVDIPLMASTVNTIMDMMQKERKLLFQRKCE